MICYEQGIKTDYFVVDSKYIDSEYVDDCKVIDADMKKEEAEKVVDSIIKSL